MFLVPTGAAELRPRAARSTADPAVHLFRYPKIMTYYLMTREKQRHDRQSYGLATTVQNAGVHFEAVLIMRAAVFAALLLLTACAPTPAPLADPDLAAETRRIRAIDNHAHPVRLTEVGEQPDRDFDALPVDSMEPQSMFVNWRPDAPGLLDAWHQLYGFTGSDLSGDHLKEAQAAKQRVQQQHGQAYPTWVLDQMGVAVMLANRVTMGPGIQPPRFRWVPYADALIFPLDNSRVAAENSDRKSFFALEDVVRRRYLDAVGLKAVPPTLAEYLSRVVTPTLERHHDGGALAEKYEAAYLRSLDFDKVDRATADRIYAQFTGKGAPSAAEYKPLQDFLFRYIATECGRLGMAVHIHTMAGAGGYFHVAGANPLLLEDEFRNAPWGLAVHSRNRRAPHQAERVSRFFGAVLRRKRTDHGGLDARVAGSCAGEGYVRHRRVSVHAGNGLGRDRRDRCQQGSSSARHRALGNAARWRDLTCTGVGTCAHGATRKRAGALQAARRSLKDNEPCNADGPNVTDLAPSLVKSATVK